MIYKALLAMALYWGGTDDPKKAMQSPFQGEHFLPLPFQLSHTYSNVCSNVKNIPTTSAAWSTVTNYALNPAFSVFELLFTNGPSLLWVDFIPCLSMLGLYVGWVYFIKAITDLYSTYSPYSHFPFSKPNSHIPKTPKQYIPSSTSNNSSTSPIQRRTRTT